MDLLKKGSWTNTLPPIHNYKYTQCNSSVHLSKQGASHENGHNSTKGLQAMISTAWIPRECNVLQCLLTIQQTNTTVFYRPLDSSSFSVLLMRRLTCKTHPKYICCVSGNPCFRTLLPSCSPSYSWLFTGKKSVPGTHYYGHVFPSTPDSNQRVISRFLQSLMSWY